MATWNDLFDASLHEIGVLEAGSTGAAADRTYCLGVVNRMLGSWSAEVGPLHYETTEALTWASGNASRTIGTGGNLNTDRPIKILAAQYRIGDEDYDLEIVSHQEYQGISNKSMSNTAPEYLAYNPTISGSLGTLQIWPIPQDALTLRLTSYKPFATISDQTATVVLPPGYEAAIVSNLAHDIHVTPFGRPYNPMLAAKAASTLSTLKQANIMAWIQPSRNDPMAPGASSEINPRSMWNI